VGIGMSLVQTAKTGDAKIQGLRCLLRNAVLLQPLDQKALHVFD
jgi:hypothetical protein